MVKVGDSLSGLITAVKIAMQRIVEMLWQKNAKPLILPLWALSKWLHKQFRFGSASNANEEHDSIKLKNANHSKVVAYALMNMLRI